MKTLADDEHEEAVADSVIGSGKPKTAVVVIHGMSEQRPMQTIHRFVSALWTRDEGITSPRNWTIYSKPDTITGIFELRRITTRHVPLENHKPKRVDFFEFYWGHLMEGKSIGGVLWWLKDLLFRNPATIPQRLRLAWYLAVPVVLLGLLIGIYSSISDPLSKLLAEFQLPSVPSAIGLSITGLAILLSLFIALWIVPVAGGAARYLSPRPENVAARQQIREAGIDLLDKLHKSQRYDRIIVVGHSLGSVIGYDVLNYAWGRLLENELLNLHSDKSPALAALNDLEKAAGALVHADDATAKGQARVDYRAKQRVYQDCLRAERTDKPRFWAVTDFVTLGSPLSKADLLVASDAQGFEDRKKVRELPTSPPVLEKDDRTNKHYRFSYPVNRPVRIPHHACVFAPVVWTNIFFETVAIVFGDPIGGPVRQLFGPGVVDVRIPAQFLSSLHRNYWNVPSRRKQKPAERAADAMSKSNFPALRALRRAANLKLLDDVALWGNQSAADEILAMLLS